MKPLRFVGQDEHLTTEQGTFTLPTMKAIARRMFKGRELFGQAIKYVPEGTQTYSYDILTEVSAARIDPRYPGPNVQDLIGVSRTSANINTIHKETVITKADLDASRMSGAPLDTSTIDSLTYKVGLLEDKMLLVGSAVTDGTAVAGLYNTAVASGNKDDTNYDWATEANIATSINAMITLLNADHYLPPFDLVIETEAEGYMTDPFGSGGLTYRDWVQKRIGGRIIVTEAMTAGTALLVKSGAGAFDYIIAEDLRVKTELQSVEAGEGLFAKVYVRGVPVVYDANALGAITDIS